MKKRGVTEMCILLLWVN